MCDIQKMMQNWMNEEVDGFTIFMLGWVSWMFYILALAFPSDLIALSDTFDKKEIIASLAFGLLGISIAFAWLFVAEYIRRYGEELLLNILFASGSIASLVLFAFWRVADAKGYYFLSPFSPIIAYLAISTAMAVVLHLYWTSPYMLNEKDEDNRGLLDEVFNDVLVRG